MGGCKQRQPFDYIELTVLYYPRNYVDAATAAQDNLTFASSTNFIARADFTTTLNPDGPGRNSVRLQSNKQYGIGTVLVYVYFMEWF